MSYFNLTGAGAASRTETGDGILGGSISGKESEGAMVEGMFGQILKLVQQSVSFPTNDSLAGHLFTTLRHNSTQRSRSFDASAQSLG